MALQLKVIKENNNFTISLNGRLDTISSVKLEETIDNEISSINALILDFKEVEYMSSAGLRVILKTKKALGNEKLFKIINVNDGIYEIFEMTGFSDFIQIERLK